MPHNRILLVEDEPALLDGLRDILELYGYEVVTATNGVEGLAAMAQSRPDVIICDVLMPHMNGFQFCEAVRGQPAGSMIPFIFLTALSDKQNRRQATTSGGDDLLAKPVDTDDLLHLIRARLIASQARRSVWNEALSDMIRRILTHMFREIPLPLQRINRDTDQLMASWENLDELSFQNTLHDIRDSSEHLRLLIEDVIFLVEVETGQAEKAFLQRRSLLYDLRGLIAQTAEIFQAEVAGSSIQLDLVPPTSLPPIQADTLTLQHALIRLLDYAYQLSQATRPVIRVRVGAVDGYIRIAVAPDETSWTEDGPVAGPEILQQNEPGWAAMRKIADMHGGWLEEPGRQDRQAELVLVLPSLDQTGRHPANLEAPVAPAQSENPPILDHHLWPEVALDRFNESFLFNPLPPTPSLHKRVLIVEDEPALLNGLRDVLSLEGYEVLAATNGSEALEIMGAVQPDLIVSDIRMPRMNGYDFCKSVRSRPEWVTIPFIFLTAMGERPNVWLAKQLGANSYLTKPVDTADLLFEIREGLKRQEREGSYVDPAITEFKRGILTTLNHEFRTPLTYIVAYTGMLDETGPDEARSARLDYLHSIRVGCSRLHQVIEDIIFLVNLESGEMARRYQDRRTRLSALPEIISQVATAQAQRLARRNQTLVVDIPDSLPPVIGDAELLRNAIHRLLDNASKFTPNHLGRLTLSARVKVPSGDATGSGQVEIAIGDNGRGIDPLNLEQIFRVFTQPDRRKCEHEGAGLGLPIARGIVRLFGGDIHVHSQPGEGSTFTIALPSVD